MISETVSLITTGKCCIQKITVFKGVPEMSEFICRKGSKITDRFFYIKKGDFYIKEFGKDTIYAPAGTLIHLPADVEYVSHWKNISSGEFFSFDYFLYDLDSKRIHLTDRIQKMLSDKTGEVYSLINDAFENQYKHTKYSPLILHSRFYEILNILFKNEEKQKLKQEKNSSEIYKAIMYLEDNFMTDVTTEELAKMCNMSNATFRRVFKNYKNCSPMHYKNSLRMIRAREMLESGAYNVSEVTELVKCSDISHFNKLYNKQFGINPSESRPKID